MANKLKTKPKQELKLITMDAGSAITLGWATLMLTLFPLFFTNYYFNILQAKYGCYLAISGVYLGLMLLMALLKKVKIDWRLSLEDKILLVFLGVCTISTFTAAPYIKEAIFGNEGRYNGLILMFMYCAVFFVASRFFEMKDWLLKAFLWVALFMGIFAITDFFDMNILHFKDNIADSNYSSFTSTMGNINTFTTFEGIVVALTSCLLIFSDREKSRMVFYGVGLFVAIFGGIAAMSDNFWLAAGAVYALLPLVALKNWKTLRRYLLSVSILLATVKLVDFIQTKYAAKVIYVGGFTGKIIELPFFNGLLIAVLVITAAVYALTIVKKLENVQLPKILPIIWGVLLAAGFISVTALIIWANKNPDAAYEKFSSLAEYLVFSDAWGSGRGYIWKATFEDYPKLSIIKQIFGSGPDTFGIYMVTGRYEDMVSKTGVYFDSAHNELLHYFFTLGPIGLGSYLALLAVIVYKCFKKAKEKGFMLYAYAFIVIAYVAQSTVNINLPIATPIFWAFLTMAASEIREIKTKTNNKPEEEKG